MKDHEKREKLAVQRSDKEGWEVVIMERCVNGTLYKGCVPKIGPKGGKTHCKEVDMDLVFVGYGESKGHTGKKPKDFKRYEINRRELIKGRDLLNEIKALKHRFRLQKFLPGDFVYVKPSVERHHPTACHAKVQATSSYDPGVQQRYALCILSGPEKGAVWTWYHEDELTLVDKVNK